MFETYTLKNFEAIAQNEIKKFTKTYDEWKVSSHSMLVKVPWNSENYELTHLEISLVIKTKNEPTRQKTLTIVVDL